jgi:hypothetical protein
MATVGIASRLIGVPKTLGVCPAQSQRKAARPLSRYDERRIRGPFRELPELAA